MNTERHRGCFYNIQDETHFRFQLDYETTLKSFLQQEDVTMIKQLRLSQDSVIFKSLLIAGFLLSLLMSNPVRGEGTCDSYIVDQPRIPVNNAGAIVLPSGILGCLTQGTVSPILQYTLFNHTLSQAIQKTLDLTPDVRVPYVAAKEKFDWGICELTKSFQAALVLVLLPQLSQNRQNGGTQEPGACAAKQHQALAMAQAFQSTAACGNSSDEGFDPNIIAVITAVRCS